MGIAGSAMESVTWRVQCCPYMGTVCCLSVPGGVCVAVPLLPGGCLPPAVPQVLGGISLTSWAPVPCRQRSPGAVPVPWLRLPAGESCAGAVLLQPRWPRVGGTGTKSKFYSTSSFILHAFPLHILQLQTL